MIKFSDITVSNMENALRGLRNPMNSWLHADSSFEVWYEDYIDEIIFDHAIEWTKAFFPNVDRYELVDTNPFKDVYLYLQENALSPYFECEKPLVGPDVPWDYVAFIGPNDMDLACRMVRAGSDEAKFTRQIFVTLDITAPLYWWKEMDQYKVATTTNSTSTMHKIHSYPITMNDFSADPHLQHSLTMQTIVEQCEKQRQLYMETKNKDDWRALIQMLPESYNQLRTWTGNYQILRNIYFARKNHKLQEWRDFCEMVEHLPYAADLILAQKGE